MNINVCNHIVKFSPIYIDLIKNKNKFTYLFILNYYKICRNYLIDINMDDFTNFLNLCLETPIMSKSTRINFELDIISLVNKYINATDTITRKVACIVIGRLLLSNIKYKNFSYLKKLELYFYEENEIKYLIIMINNLIECTKYDIAIKPSIKDINMIDFVFDYYSDN